MRNLDPRAFVWIADPKTWRPVSSAEATEHWLKHTKGPLDSHYYEERWHRARIVVHRLRTAQDTYGEAWPLAKHALMSDILEENRQAVVEGTFPKASSIKEGFVPPAIIVLLDRAGEAHVTDGLGRTFMSLWNGNEHIDGYVFDEGSHRPLPTRHTEGN